MAGISATHGEPVVWPSRIAAVKGSEKLSGFWGGDPAKTEPTLGQRAKELADKLQKGGK